MKVLNFLFSIPSRTYWKVVHAGDAYRPTTGYFWWREAWHFVGGFLVASPLWFARPLWLFLILCCALAGVLVVAEVDDANRGQPWWKTVLDMTAWFLGFSIVLLAR